MSEDKAYEASRETADAPSSGNASVSSSNNVQSSEQVASAQRDIAPTDGAKKAPAEEDFFVAEEYGDSFAALKESMVQGYELSVKRKAFEEYTKTLNTLKDAHDDRVNIANNYDAVVAEQQGIIAASTADVESCNARIRQIDAQIAAKNDEFAQMKNAQAVALKPLEEELTRCEAMLASAQDEFKQVKAQRESLDLFEAKSQNAQESQDSHDRIVADVDAKREAAKAAQREAQRALDAQVKADKAEQRRVSDEIKKLNAEKDGVAKELQEHQKKVNAANDRIAFCNHVIEHPEETENMQRRIVENEATATEMQAQINQLSTVHEKSVRASSKARTVVIVGVVAVIVFIILFIIVGNR